MGIRRRPCGPGQPQCPLECQATRRGPWTCGRCLQVTTAQGSVLLPWFPLPVLRGRRTEVWCGAVQGLAHLQPFLPHCCPQGAAGAWNTLSQCAAVGMMKRRVIFNNQDSWTEASSGQRKGPRGQGGWGPQHRVLPRCPGPRSSFPWFPRALQAWWPGRVESIAAWLSAPGGVGEVSPVPPPAAAGLGTGQGWWPPRTARTCSVPLCARWTSLLLDLSAPSEGSSSFSNWTPAAW